MELEELLTRKLQFCEYLESWGLDESSRRIAMLYDELDRLRAENAALRSEVDRRGRIEDAFRSRFTLHDDGSVTIDDPVAAIQVMIDNPRPETAP
jgi:hypothetical protein